jgi:uncharacterized membrane protein YphA (DoxX/SURF4 family)
MQSLLDLLIPAAQAHEKWFVPVDVSPVRPGFFYEWNAWTVTTIVAVIAMVAVGMLIDRKFEASGLYARVEKRIAPLRDYAAGVLAVCTGVSLLWSAAHGTLLVDNFMLGPTVTAGAALRIFEGVVGFLLLVGLYTPIAAMSILILFGAVVGAYGVLEASDYLHYVGIAVFLLAFARGKWSLDWLLGKDFVSQPRERRLSYLALRVIAGLMFIVLAMGKWARPELHLALMERYPDLNPYVILHWIGINPSPEVYVYVLFAIEILIGVAVLTGIVTRIVALSLIPVIVASTVFLGFGELFGHLPIIGILFVLFVFGDRYHKEKGAFDLSTPSVPRY